MTHSIQRAIDWLLVDAGIYVVAWFTVAFVLVLGWVLYCEWCHAHNHQGPIR